MIDYTNSLLPNFQKGDVIYKDQNNDGVIDSKDLVPIGNPNPELTYGFTNNFKYKNVDLSILLQGTLGNELMTRNLIARSFIQGLIHKEFVWSSGRWE